mmetsp:Transcript_5687/g.12615  ORF Transcript_5687/g.12615 Transcript_5687/m.12615 type:complete len:281 (-) Transcript_5687:787-1629(-)
MRLFRAAISKIRERIRLVIFFGEIDERIVHVLGYLFVGACSPASAGAEELAHRLVPRGKVPLVLIRCERVRAEEQEAGAIEDAPVLLGKLVAGIPQHLELLDEAVALGLKVQLLPEEQHPLLEAFEHWRFLAVLAWEVNHEHIHSGQDDRFILGIQHLHAPAVHVVFVHVCKHLGDFRFVAERGSIQLDVDRGQPRVRRVGLFPPSPAARIRGLNACAALGCVQHVFLGKLGGDFALALLGAPFLPKTLVYILNRDFSTLTPELCSSCSRADLSSVSFID